jgi:hypothetical protein
VMDQHRIIPHHRTTYIRLACWMQKSMDDACGDCLRTSLSRTSRTMVFQSRFVSPRTPSMKRDALRPLDRLNVVSDSLSSARVHPLWRELEIPIWTAYSRILLRICQVGTLGNCRCLSRNVVEIHLR